MNSLKLRLNQNIFQGINTVPLSLTEAGGYFAKAVGRKPAKGRVIYYLNAHTLRLILRFPELKEAYQRATIVYFDGWGAVWLARLAGLECKERITTGDFFGDFLKEAEKVRLSLFLVGGTPEVINKTVERLSAEFPNLIIKGYSHGYFSDSGRLEKKIATANPDLLLVGTGSPKQELWLDRNPELAEGRTAWVVGGLFDYLSGKSPKAPKIIGKLYLEWLFRLACEPGRLFKRYFIGLPELVLRLGLPALKKDTISDKKYQLDSWRQSNKSKK